VVAAWATALVACDVPGRPAAGRSAMVVDGRCGRVAGATESGSVDPLSVGASGPGPVGSVGISAGAVAGSTGAGIGSGWAVSVGEAVTSTGVAWSVIAQLGSRVTAVVPRRKTTSAEPSSGIEPLDSPFSRSRAPCPVRLTNRTLPSAGTVMTSTEGVDLQERPSTPPPAKTTCRPPPSTWSALAVPVVSSAAPSRNPPNAVAVTRFRTCRDMHHLPA
jgi:hypothetical protein